MPGSRPIPDRNLCLILVELFQVLTPSFFGTPLRSHYSIFSPQIMQENWLTYCSMKRQNYSRDKLGVYFQIVLCPNIPYFLWIVYMVVFLYIVLQVSFLGRRKRIVLNAEKFCSFCRLLIFFQTQRFQKIVLEMPSQ